jgi:hypothetical protein
VRDSDSDFENTGIAVLGHVKLGALMGLKLTAVRLTYGHRSIGKMVLPRTYA